MTWLVIFFFRELVGGLAIKIADVVVLHLSETKIKYKVNKEQRCLRRSKARS